MIDGISKSKRNGKKPFRWTGRAFRGIALCMACRYRGDYASFASRAWETSFTPGVPSTSMIWGDS